MNNSERFPLSRGQRPFDIIYDRTRCMPPDVVSERIGESAAQAVDRIRAIYQNPDRAIKVLEVGIGTGLMSVTMLAAVGNPNNLAIAGFDIDDYCVESARFNLGSLIKQHQAQSTFDIWQASWDENATWEKVAHKGLFDIVLFNPPYLPKHEAIEPGYEGVPISAGYTTDNYGLQHYISVLPKIATVLNVSQGSTAFIRKSSRYINDSDQTRRFEEIIDPILNSRKQLLYKNVVEQVTEKYKGNWIVLEQQ